MEILYEKEYLRELYEEGKCRDKKRRYQPSIIKSYQICVTLLGTVNRIEDLFPFNFLKYKALSGKKKGVSSVRINDQYRLEFTVTTDKTSDKPIITICTLIDISNHYE